MFLFFEKIFIIKDLTQYSYTVIYAKVVGSQNGNLPN